MSSINSYVCIKYAGNLLKVQKAPYETEEKAHDRAWYIGKQLMGNDANDANDANNANEANDANDDNDLNNVIGNNKSWLEKSSLSHIWANEKYLSMKYK